MRYDKQKPEGLSDRDWFAGMALVANQQWTPAYDAPKDEDGFDLPFFHPEHVAARHKARAEWCFAQADAMLRARETGHD